MVKRKFNHLKTLSTIASLSLFLVACENDDQSEAIEDNELDMTNESSVVNEPTTDNGSDVSAETDAEEEDVASVENYILNPFDETSYDADYVVPYLSNTTYYEEYRKTEFLSFQVYEDEAGEPLLILEVESENLTEEETIIFRIETHLIFYQGDNELVSEERPKIPESFIEEFPEYADSYGQNYAELIAPGETLNYLIPVSLNNLSDQVQLKFDVRTGPINEMDTLVLLL